MNKQELIKKIEALPAHNARINKGIVLDLVEQLDEPQPVKVSQCVADWYEENKDSFEFNVWDWVAFRDEAKKSENREFKNWINNRRENPIQTLVNMHQFGYEVKKEKRYRVKMKAIKSNSQYLVFGQLSETWWFGSAEQIGNVKSEHTRKEIEDAGFGEVFNSPLFEVEEVQDVS